MSLWGYREDPCIFGNVGAGLRRGQVSEPGGFLVCGRRQGVSSRLDWRYACCNDTLAAAAAAAAVARQNSAAGLRQLAVVGLVWLMLAAFPEAAGDFG